MNKEFIPYEQALVLKQLGFDEPCFGYYFGKDKEVYLLDGQMSAPFEPSLDSKVMFRAPLKQQAFRWFREKYGLCNFINFSGDGFCSGWEDLGNNEHGFENFKTYEEAEQACLDKLIEICKNK